MMSDSFFADAGWLFFAIWSIAVSIVSITAFGSDLVPAKAPASSRSTTPAQARQNRSGKL
ncbi:MAG TPA: hypothetical protein VJP02_14160 [Candidatus Sulfotelmatobacter sp.]|nr:hypothetical protein [Candidatus Sulfotelmatobacter sp.]